MITRISELHGCLRNRNQLLITLVTLLAPLSLATASTMPFSGSTSGVFLSPNFDETVVDVNGNIIHQDVSQQPPFYSGFGTNSIVFGSGGSSLTFTGTSFSGISANPNSAPFEIGTLSYFNSVDGLDLGGAMLRISLNTNQGTINETLNLSFLVTANTGISPQRDSDWVQGIIPGNPSISLNAFEGATVTGIVFGSILGDPTFKVTSITLAPGQQGNGFVGNGINDIPKTPDTGTTFWFFVIGLAAVALVRPKYLAAA
jgi:hypothetical protein